jgi:PAS domain S-box-containing protein
LESESRNGSATAAKTILLVNDDIPTLYAVGRTLRRAGYSVVEAQTGESALAWLAKQSFDLAVLDIHLPGISGFEVCRNIKRSPATATLPVLYLTGSSSSSSDRLDDFDGGGDCYLTHPVEPAVLLATVRALLRLYRAEKSARAAAIEWQASFRAISDGIAILDPQGRVVRYNRAFQRLAGRDERELQGVHFTELFHASPPLAELFGRLSSTYVREEQLIETADHWLRASVDPLAGEAGEPQGAVLILADITAQKRSEAALQRSEEMFRALFENAKDAIMIADDRGRYVDVNPAACEVLGIPREELTRLALWDLVPPHQNEMAHSAWYHFLREGEQEGIFQLLARDGTPRLVDYRARANFLPGLHLSALRDITERARIEQALRESEERFRVALQGSTISVFSQDRELRYTWVYNSHLPLAPDEFVGKIDSDLTSARSAGKLTALKELVLATGERQRAEIQVDLPNNTSTLELQVEPLRDAEGRTLGVIGAATDVTERKRTEEDLRAYHRQLRELSAHIETVREEERARVAQEVHDELGQALTGLKLEIASIIRDLPPRNRSLAPRLRAMAELVDGTIQSVRRISTELRPVILDELGLVPAIEWYAGTFEQRTGIRCKFESQATETPIPAPVSVACFRIVQEALTNIARHSGATEAEIELRQTEDALWLSVRDNGVGVSEESLTNRKSMGLAGMRERAAALGGALTIGARGEGGTAVSLTLPLEQGDSH